MNRFEITNAEIAAQLKDYLNDFGSTCEAIKCSINYEELTGHNFFDKMKSFNQILDIMFSWGYAICEDNGEESPYDFDQKLNRVRFTCYKWRD